METRELYHGTNGDNILQIIKFGLMKPNADGKLYFSQVGFHSVFMHGPDLKRKQTFAIKVRVKVPNDSIAQRYPTPGVANTLVLHTADPVFAEVLDLYIRAPRGGDVETIQGTANIKRYLSGRSGPSETG
jgi:hypothetical protein